MRVYTFSYKNRYTVLVLVMFTWVLTCWKLNIRGSVNKALNKCEKNVARRMRRGRRIFHLSSREGAVYCEAVRETVTHGTRASGRVRRAGCAMEASCPVPRDTSRLLSSTQTASSSVNFIVLNWSAKSLAMLIKPIKLTFLFLFVFLLIRLVFLALFLLGTFLSWFFL